MPAKLSAPPCSGIYLNPISLFIALIGFPSLANADCSETLMNRLIDNHFLPAQIFEMCGKVSSQPATETKPPPIVAEPAATPTAEDTKAAVNAIKAADTIVDAVAKAKAIQGKINTPSTTPADISGRKIRLDQDDSQYSPTFYKVGDKQTPRPSYTCGVGCVYKIKQDDGKTLTVNIDKVPASTGNSKVKQFEDYTIDKATHEKLDYSYVGLTYGALVIPFKWQFHDHSIAGSASLGPYVGYQLGKSWGDFGINITPLASFGITNIAVQNQANSSTLSNIMGFTLAVGAGFSINKSQSSLQGGFVCGQDRAGTSTPTPYKYEGKTWCALELGFPFTQ